MDVTILCSVGERLLCYLDFTMQDTQSVIVSRMTYSENACINVVKHLVLLPLARFTSLVKLLIY